MKKLLEIVKKFFVYGYFLPIIGILTVGAIGYLETLGAFNDGEVKIVTKSNLMEAIDVSNLSTSEFIYNGIAEVYDNEKKEKIKYHIRYDARVKAGIDIENVDFVIIEEENIIEVTLPKIEIFTPPSIDPNSLSYIPSQKEYDLKEVLETCETDVLRETEDAIELKETATESLKAIIEALLKPIIEPEGYKIRWNEYVEEETNGRS